MIQKITAQSDVGQKLISRYRQGYSTGSAAIFIGYLLKGLGSLVIAISLVMSFDLINRPGSSSNQELLCGLVGVFSGLGVCAHGVLFCAVGHMTRATLDTAVNSSPVASDAQKAGAMAP